MEMNIKRDLAKLALRVGVDLQKDQCLQIRVGVGNYEYARVIANEAYRMGARFVRMQVIDNELIRSRIEHSSKENLRYVPRDLIEKGRLELDEDWAHIRIDNNEEMDILSDVSATALGEMTKHHNSALNFVAEQLMRHKHPWLVLAVPGPNWARKIYGLADDASDEMVQATLENFEKLYMSILRLDHDDPIATWKKLGSTLALRSKKLNELRLDRVRFLSGRTDLSVGLARTHVWTGGPAQLPDGRWHEPNLPSEEVFTAPDFRRVEGFVQVLRPVNVMANSVLGAWFRFQEGRVVDCGAERGAAILEQYLSIDEGARYLGEVALVDIDSPINRSGLVFGNILFDENASCHIALGAAYPICLSNENELPDAGDLRAAGCNVSMMHTDFMISNDETDVIGYQADGSEIQIIKAGKFVI